MPRVIVERNFETPFTQEELSAVEARMGPCLDLYNVRWIRSYWLPTGCVWSANTMRRTWRACAMSSGG